MPASKTGPQGHDHRYLVLGISASVYGTGYCLIDTVNHQILEQGCQMYDQARNAKSHESLATERRNSRSARRNIKRTKDRKDQCLRLLKKCGLVPENADASWLDSAKGDAPVLELRVKGLDHRLTDRELAQVLYSICGRRGYIPHGEASKISDDADSQKILKALRANEVAMEQGGYRTVGEMLLARGSVRNTAGHYDNFVSMEQLMDEAAKILGTQRTLGNARLTKTFQDDFMDVAQWQKDTQGRDAHSYSLVGPCAYFPDEVRAARADLTSEMCSAWEALNNLVIVDFDGEEIRLSHERIERYMGILFQPTHINGKPKAELTYARIRRDITDMDAEATFKNVEPDKEREREPYVPRAWRTLRAALPDELLRRMLADHGLADAIGEALTYASSQRSLTDRLHELVPDIADADVAAIIDNVPYSSKVFSGYGSRSLRALSMLVDAFDDPATDSLAAAERACGLDGVRAAGHAVRAGLLPPYDRFDPSCSNPVVLRAMARLRRVVNAIIRAWRVPDEIHVQLDRDLRQDAHERREIGKRNAAGRRRNAALAAEAAGYLGCEAKDVPGNLVFRLGLLHEQGDTDPFTGGPISPAALCQREGEYVVSYILPWERAYDDTSHNKLVLPRATAAAKGARTPWEWAESGEPGAPEWELLRDRVKANVGDPRKRDRIMREGLTTADSAQALGRYVADTRWVCAACRDYLQQSLLYPEPTKSTPHDRVLAVSAGAVRYLADAWDLSDRVPDRGREDPAMPYAFAKRAAAIAACSPAAVARVSTAAGGARRDALSRLDKDELAALLPWPGFAAQSRARAAVMVPTRMSNHGVTGQVHQETLYSVVSDDGKGHYTLSANGRQRVSGNVYLLGDGSAKMVGDQAFARLWLDPDADRGHGRRGRWYLEVVYCEDIPRLKAGTYVPRYVAHGYGRPAWPEVPADARRLPPVTLHRGDVLVVDDHVARYISSSISSGALRCVNLLTQEVAHDIPPITRQWDATTDVRVLQEDCLGRCYQGMVLDRESTLYRRSLSSAAGSASSPVGTSSSGTSQATAGPMPMAHVACPGPSITAVTGDAAPVQREGDR